MLKRGSPKFTRGVACYRTVSQKTSVLTSNFSSIMRFRFVAVMVSKRAVTSRHLGRRSMRRTVCGVISSGSAGCVFELIADKGTFRAGVCASVPMPVSDLKEDDGLLPEAALSGSRRTGELTTKIGGGVDFEDALLAIAADRGELFAEVGSFCFTGFLGATGFTMAEGFDC